MAPSPFEIAAPIWASNWNVLPLVGKRPIEPTWPRWCKERQPSDYIKGYLNTQQSLNIGLPLGQNGLLAIDIDTDEPDQLKSILEALPPIIAAKRGKRGLTAFYLTSGHGITTRRMGLVEILSHGTQTVIPPSIHPGTRQPYTWLEPSSFGAQGRLEFTATHDTPDFRALSLFTNTDCERLCKTIGALTGKVFKSFDEHPAISNRIPSSNRHSRYTAATKDNLVAELTAATEGCRNSALNWSAFRLGQLQVPFDEVSSLLLPIAVEIGLGHHEIKATIRSGWTAGAAKAGQRGSS